MLVGAWEKKYIICDNVINVTLVVADTRTVTRTPLPHTRDPHSPGLAELRRTESGAETAGQTGRSRVGETTVRSRGKRGAR